MKTYQFLRKLPAAISSTRYNVSVVGSRDSLQR
jgi:hypothetical protein